jgi:hypothetical protein
LIHILPLFLLALALIISNSRNPSFVRGLLLIVVVLFTVVHVKEVLVARSITNKMDESNHEAISGIEHAIDSSWHGKGRPRVLTETPSLARLSTDHQIETMTDHFISFPVRNEPIDSFLIREHVNYVVLYNSPTYPKDRPREDSFYVSVQRVGHLMAKEIGKTGDVGRDYFHPSPWQDTLLLFQLRRD